MKECLQELYQKKVDQGCNGGGGRDGQSPCDEHIQADWETDILGKWETGKQGNRKSGKQGNRESGKLGNWESGKLGNWEIGSLAPLVPLIPLVLLVLQSPLPLSKPQLHTAKPLTTLDYSSYTHSSKISVRSHWQCFSASCLKAAIVPIPHLYVS